jgi:mRNA-degrading endonuclease RelE of RelBE toxin-antitoxin system
MKSYTTPDFWKSYAALPPKIKAQAKKAYQLWEQDPSYPALHFKKIKEGLWSARISGGYRALALKEGDDYYWIWAGAHDEHERLIR